MRINKLKNMDVAFSIVITVLSVIVGFALSESSKFGTPTLTLLVFLIALLIFGMIFYLEIVRRAMTDLTGGNEYSVTWTKTFEQTASYLKKSKKSVYVVTSIGERFEHLDSDKSRSGYLDIMLDVFERNKNNSMFEYFRVMPARRFNDLVDGTDSVYSHDPQVAIHLENVRKYIGDNKGERIVQQLEFYMCGLIPLCPSILVIDSEYICFALPEKRRNAELTNDLSQYQLKGVLIIRDRSGETPREIIKLIRSFGEGQFNLLQETDVRTDEG